MNRLFFESNLDYRKYFNYSTRFIFSLGVATLSGMAQARLRQLQYQYQDPILQKTGLEPNRIADIRRSLRPVVLVLSTAFFFKEEKVSLSDFIKKHFLIIAIEGIICLEAIEPFHSLTEKFYKKISIPPLLEKLSKKIVNFIEPILQLALGNDAWLNAFGTAVIEETIFRGLLQEVLLRQVPKLCLKATKLASPELVDSPICTIIRISISSFMFGLGHLQHKGVSRVFNTTLSGIAYGYTQEKIGFLPSVLSHFDLDFYVNLSKPPKRRHPLSPYLS